jgi:hypothetical protein
MWSCSRPCRPAFRPRDSCDRPPGGELMSPAVSL